MAVPELGAVLEGLHGLVAVGAVVGRRRDDAVGHRVDRGAAGSGEVEAGVVARPQAVLAEGGGQVVADDREVPEVQLDLGGLLLGLGGERRPRAFELLDLLLGRGLDVVVGGVGERVASRVAADDGTTAAGLDGGGHVAAAAEGAGLHDLGGRRPVGGADQLRVGRGQRAARRDGQGGDAEQDRRRRQSADQRLARSRPAAGGRSAGRLDDRPLLGRASPPTGWRRGLGVRVARAGVASLLRAARLPGCESGVRGGRLGHRTAVARGARVRTV